MVWKNNHLYMFSTFIQITKHNNTMENKYLYWTPRILTTIFILFISLFALDVFSEYAFPEVLVALFMHLIPSYILAGLLWLAWKKELYGGIGFIFLSIVFTIFFKTYQDLITFLLISFPALVIGVLFLVGWYLEKK
jgi:hypothetical protein